MVAERSSTYNNTKEHRREDYEQWVMPVQDDFRESAEAQIFRDMETDAKLQLRHDYSNVAIVQRDRIEVAKETDILVRNRTINKAEARERHNYDFDKPEYQDEWFPVPQTNITLSPIGAAEPETEPKEEDDDTEDIETAEEDEQKSAGKGTRIKKGELEQSASFWSEHPALTDEQRSMMDSEPYINGKAN